MPSIRFLKQMFRDTWRPMRAPVEKPQPRLWLDDAITGSCLGHSTVLINFLGLWILTDPVFSTRVGPGVGPLVIGPKRYLKPALRPRELPKIDLILQSHAHFDHLDRPSLRRLPRSATVVTAGGTADLFRRFRRVVELSWGDSVTLETRRGSVRVTALEIVHWGTRMLRDTHREYCGYLVEHGGRAICFAGDTAYTTTFRRIQDLNTHLDLIFMPIGAYNPWVYSHCNPEQAAAMANQAGARYFVPIHHETFRLSAEPMDEPARRIEKAFAMQPERLLAVHVGQTFRVPEMSPLRSESPARLDADA